MNQILIIIYRNLSSLTLFVRRFFSYFKKRVHSILRGAWKDLFVAVSLICFIIFSIVLSNIIWALNVKIPVFGQLQNHQVTQSTKIYDRSGKVLLYDTLGGMRRTTIPLSAISPYIVSATIAIEDESFYEHGGVSPVAILRAAVINMKSLSFGQGGSTITQQVVKNTILTKDKSLIRKIKEVIIAVRIEKHYSKNEILEIYLNETPYGGIIYGVEEASREYFNKSAKDLTLSESAYLASLPKAPTYLSPWGENFSALKNRHNLVLKKMLEKNMISEKEYISALEENTVFANKSTENIKAPHFVFYVLNELEKKYGKDKVYEEGLQIKTTLDWDLQKESEKIIREGALSNEKKFNASNAGLVAVDPKSGQVLAMVGSRNFFDDKIDGQVNIATSLRQPGSTFKPFAYATAFKKGYTPETVLFDLKTQFSTACAPWNLSSDYPCYSPENYDEKYRGPMTMRDALAQSINVVGVKTLYLAGIHETIKMAESLGITTLKNEERYGLSLVLGGGEVTLLELTGAYGVFANDGIKHKTTPIISITNAKGDILETYNESGEQVLDSEIARTINSILSDNNARAPAFGFNSPLYFKDSIVANKTGTTNDYRDVWVVGYTPSIVVGTWAGNNNNLPMEKKVASFILAPMWHSAMEKAIARFPGDGFVKPEENIASLPRPLDGTWDESSPVGIHEILFWINKEDPRSQLSGGSFSDPQFAQWEYPVSLWANELAYSRAMESINLYNALNIVPVPNDQTQIVNTYPVYNNMEAQIIQPQY